MSIEEIKEKICEAYGLDKDDEYDMECGCYVNGKWLSIRNILDALER